MDSFRWASKSMFCSKLPLLFINSAVSCHQLPIFPWIQQFLAIFFFLFLYCFIFIFYFFAFLIVRLPTACSCFLEPVHGYLGRVRRSEGRDFEDRLGLSSDQSLNQENILYRQDYVEGSQRRAQVEDQGNSSSNNFFNVSLASFVQPISRSNANSWNKSDMIKNLCAFDKDRITRKARKLNEYCRSNHASSWFDS